MTSTDYAELCRQANGVREIFWPYDRVKAVHADIARLHARDNGASEGGILALFGESRSGKTKMLRSYAKQHPKVVKGRVGKDGEFADLMEVVVLRVPDTNVKNLLERLLAVLSNLDIAQVKGAGTRRFDIQEDIVKIAKAVGLKLILLEEAHQAIDAKNDNVARTVAGVLKDLTNEARFSMVISGTSKARRLFEASEELDGRVLYEHELTPLRWEDLAERSMFLEVLQHLDDHLAANVFGRLSGLADERFAKPLLKASLGHIGHAATLVETAAVAAVGDMLGGACRTLTYEHLGAALSGSPLRRKFKPEEVPFRKAKPRPNPVSDDDPVTKLQGRKQVTGRDAAFKR